MMDLNKWIYAKGLAAWLIGKDLLDTNGQIDCICMAPHKTLEEKLNGLKELNTQCDKKILEDKITEIEFQIGRSSSETHMWPYLYSAEIFWKGEAMRFLPKIIFRTAKLAEEEICQRIENLETEFHVEREDCYGIVKVFENHGSPFRFIHTENFITRYDGKVISIQKAHNVEGWSSFEIGAETLNCLKIPYSSGTIVSIAENPFFPSLKGILVNTTEPEDDNFFDDPYNQWLIYPSSVHTNVTHGIGIANLGNDYLPFQENQDFRVPYKQFIDIYGYELEENEIWLSELSSLIKSDKNYFHTILHDRQPKSGMDTDMDKERLNYVRKLAAK